MNQKKRTLLKTLLTMIVDFILLGAGLYLAWTLWKSGPHNQEGEIRVWLYSPLFLIVYMGGLWLTGTYRVVWKYADIRDMLRLLLGCGLSAGVCLLLNRVFSFDYSRMVIGFHGVFSFVLLVAGRYAWLLVQNLTQADLSEKHVRRSLIIGAGPEGTALVKALRGLKDGARHEPVAFLDDDVDKLYRRISGLPVEGTSADIDKVIRTRHVDEVLFTSPLEKSEALIYLYTHAITAGCAVSRYEVGVLKNMELRDVLDGARWDEQDIPLSYRHNIAIIGAGELARELAVLCSENGAGKVFCLDSDPNRLGEMARAGAWCRLGSPSGEKTLRDFLRQARPSYVFYMAGVSEQSVVEGNEQAVVRMNVISPLNALRFSPRASAFVYVTDTRDEEGSARLFAAGEAAVLSRAAEGPAVSVVAVNGLLDSNGPLSRMLARAHSGKALCVHKGLRKAFISCRSAASALIAMAQCGCEGCFTVQGTVTTDLYDLAETVIQLTGDRAGVETAETEEAEISPNPPEPTLLSYVFSREKPVITLPPEIPDDHPACPEAEICAALLRG